MVYVYLYNMWFPTQTQLQYLRERNILVGYTNGVIGRQSACKEAQN